MFSLFGFIIIQMFYSAYTMSFNASLEQGFSTHNVYSNLFTGILSLLFFYIFKTKKLFSDISDHSPSSNKTISWI